MVVDRFVGYAKCDSDLHAGIFMLAKNANADFERRQIGKACGKFCKLRLKLRAFLGNHFPCIR